MKGNVEGGQKTGIQNVMDRGGGDRLPTIFVNVNVIRSRNGREGMGRSSSNYGGGGNTVGREGARKRKGKKKERPTEGFGV